MTEPAAILEVRHVRLADQAVLSPAPVADGEDGVFIAHDEPPPVRTVLAVMEGHQRRVLEVVRVVEVADRDERGTRGMYARWVDEEALTRAARVGTEHLEDGTPIVQPVERDDSSAISMSDAPGMAMPAPVMMDVDDTGVIDTEDREDADEVRARPTLLYAEAIQDDEDPAPEAGTDEAESAETDDESQASGGSNDGSEPALEAAASEAAAATEDEAETGDDAGNKRSRGGRRKRGKRRR
ncbi:MAG: hypothetical protein AB1Z98_08810 [Nannocystaceae bacterium]